MKYRALRVVTADVIAGGMAVAASAFETGANATTAGAPAAVVEAVPVEATVLKLDGELNDEVWRRAPAIHAFVQREPREGAEPTFRTEARVAYDAEHIYVAVLAHDPEPDKIVGILTRRDSSSPSDGSAWRSTRITTAALPTSSQSIRRA